jgi:FAD:protein FMN transferase
MTTSAARRFRAMGTDISVIGPADEDLETAARKVRAIFGSEEQRFSRFRSDSELSRVNERAGEVTEISPGFEKVLRAALDAAAITEGSFDPTVLPELIAAGYDRDFPLVRQVSGAPVRRQLNIAGRWREVHLSSGSLWMPRGMALDFGGIAKGWTADLAAEATDLSWVLVDAGGDMRLCGRPDVPLTIAIEDPFEAGSVIAHLELGEGALATSTVTKRSWGLGLHHLIDPQSGLPSRSPVVQATTWAGTCMAAEVSAKSVVIGGVDRVGLQPTFAVLDDGQAISSFEGKEAAA